MRWRCVLPMLLVAVVTASGCSDGAAGEPGVTAVPGGGAELPPGQFDGAGGDGVTEDTGPTPDVAPDARRPDAVTPDLPGPDPAADPGADVASWPPGPDAIAALCAAICADLEASCGLENSLQACRAKCETALAEDIGWVANYSCQQVTCDRHLCFAGDDPLPPHDACVDVCATFDVCDALSLIDLPEDLPELCELACSGVAAGSAGTLAALECMATALEPACDHAATQACLSANLCDALCALTYTPAAPGEEASPAYCEPGTAIYDTWSDASICAATCDGYDEAAQGLFAGCLAASPCEDDANCAAAGGDVDMACSVVCGALAEVCGEPVGGFADASQCAAYCSGMLFGYGVQGAGAGMAMQCASDGIDGCPGDGSAFLRALLGCVIKPSKDCEDVCEALADCELLTSEGQTQTPEECAAFCTLQEATAGTSAAAAAECIAIASSCSAVAQCVGVGVPICVYACDKEAECGVDVEGCVGTCEDDLASEPATFADIVCTIFSPCAALGACELQGTPPPQACVAACQGETACVGESGTDHCVGVCHGTMVAFGLSGQEAADCIVDNVGPECSLSLVGVCLPGGP